LIADFECEQSLRLHGFGEGAVELLPRPEPYGAQQDGPGHYVVSSDGMRIRLYGNTWKAFEIAEREITSGTILEFDFKVEELAEGHGKS
jgi:hypothetical protein